MGALIPDVSRQDAGVEMIGQPAPVAAVWTVRRRARPCSHKKPRTNMECTYTYTCPESVVLAALQWTPYPFVLRKLRINRRPAKESAQESPDLTLFLSSRIENFSPPGRTDSRPNTHAPTPARTARWRVRWSGQKLVIPLRSLLTGRPLSSAVASSNAPTVAVGRVRHLDRPTAICKHASSWRLDEISIGERSARRVFQKYSR